jgi:hypothetical protein
MTRISQAGLPFLGAALLAVALGFGVTINQQLAFVALVVIVGLVASAAPTSSWVAAALIAALTFRGLVELGALPSVATLVDLPLAWGALAVALLKRNPNRVRDGFDPRWLVALAAAVLLAWAFNPSEVLRPLLYLALLGQPFAIVAALCLDPPTARGRRMLTQTLLVLLLLQIPIAAIQVVTQGRGDPVQGTLYGAGAGAHVISAICVVGAVWLLLDSRVLPRRSWRVLAALGLLVIPFLADAKQVILATPALLLAWSWRDGPVKLLCLVAATASLVALLLLQPAGNTASSFLERAQDGRGGKAEAATFLWARLNDDPATLAFGLGPAESLSRAAFMTTDLALNANSPIRILGLAPAPLPAQAQAASLAASGGGTSFNSGLSSALGVLGDIGLLGLAVYLAALVQLLLRLRSRGTPQATAAAGGLAMLMLLGLVFDWWEQPPISVLLGVLAGLALTAPSRAPAQAGRPAFSGPPPEQSTVTRRS